MHFDLHERARTHSHTYLVFAYRQNPIATQTLSQMQTNAETVYLKVNACVSMTLAHSIASNSTPSGKKVQPKQKKQRKIREQLENMQ